MAIDPPAYRHERCPPPDVAIAAHVARRHGVASTAELLTFGLTRSGIARRAAAGRLHRTYDGVWAVGHPTLTSRGTWLAAVLACGDRAALFCRSAAALWGVRTTARRNVEVVTPRRGLRDRPGIDLHRTRVLTPDDVTIVDEIPVTTVARTLCDLAEVLDARGLQRAVHEAEVLRLLDTEAVERTAARLNGRRGLKALLQAIRVEAPPTRSELERRFLELCADAGLPRPHVNTTVCGYEVDVAWPHARLAVETDGAAVHRTRRAFEQDRRRDFDRTVAGWRVVRVTWRRIRDEPHAVAAGLRALL